MTEEELKKLGLYGTDQGNRMLSEQNRADYLENVDEQVKQQELAKAEQLAELQKQKELEEAPTGLEKVYKEGLNLASSITAALPLNSPINVLTAFDEEQRAKLVNKRLLPAKGLLQAISDVAGFIPYFKPLETTIDKFIGEEEDPGDKLARDLYAIILPTILGTGAVSGVSRAVNTRHALPAVVNNTGKLAAELGVDGVIAYTAGANATDENLTRQVNDLLGTQIPGATQEGDSAETRRHKHTFEALGMTALPAFLGASINLTKRTRKLFTKTPDGVEKIISKTPPADEVTPISTELKAVDAEYESALDSETLLRLGKRSDRKAFDLVQEIRDEVLTKPSVGKYTLDLDDVASSKTSLNLEGLQETDPSNLIQGIRRSIGLQEEPFDLVADIRRSILSPAKATKGKVKLDLDDVPTSTANKGKVKLDLDDVPTSTANKAGKEQVERVNELLSKISLKALDDLATGNFKSPTTAYDLKDPVAPGYDPFINKYATPAETYVPAAGADALEAKADIGEAMTKPGYSRSAREAPAVTQGFQEGFMKISDGDERKEFLDELFTKLSPSVGIIKDGNKKIQPEVLNQAIDKLVDTIHSSDISFDEFQSIVERMKTNVFEGGQYLSKEAYQVQANAFKKVFMELYNPNNLRASAVLTNQAAGEAQDIARAINMTDSKPMYHQNNLMFQKLELVATESRVYQYAAGNALRYSKVLDLEGPVAAAKFLEDNSLDFEKFYVTAKDEGRRTVEEWNKIAKDKPEWLKIFAEAVDHTSGLSKQNQVESLAGLKAYLDKNISVLALGVQDTEVPSWFVKGINDARYNFMLSGGAAKKALEGNIQNLALKPLTTTLGAAAQLDGGALQDALLVYGGVSENIKRAAKHLVSEWNYAVKNPTEASRRGRPDLVAKHLDNYEMMEQAAQIWKKNGQESKYMLWNISKSMYGFNNNAFVRYGYNAMFALDGFIRSMLQSKNSRMKAYAELGDRSLYGSKAEWQAAFNKKSDDIYFEYFDGNGALKQDLSSDSMYESGELAFNLDDNLASKISDATTRIPILKSLFSFERTGINALKYYYSYTPASGALGLITNKGKMGKVFRASTFDDKVEALAMHGKVNLSPEETEVAFNALKSEYIGRQMVGSTVVTLGAMWAIEGNLRGQGPQDWQEKQKLKALDWEPDTIRHPFTGKWVSYANMTPFTEILRAIADSVYIMQKADQDSQMEQFQAIATALISGPVENSFLSGLEPLVQLLNGDESAWDSWKANTFVSMVPYSGALTMYSRIVVPQLKDTERNMFAKIKNRFKGFFENDLHDVLDVYTNKPINWTDPFIAALNEVLPFFKTNSGEEEWRFKLIQSGWKGMPSYKVNPFTGEELTSKERSFINNWVAKNFVDDEGNSLLVAQIEELFDPTTEIGKVAMQSLEQYLASDVTEDVGQKGFPIKNIFLHDQLDAIHKEAFDMAFSALYQKYEEYGVIGQLRKQMQNAKEAGNIEYASELSRQVESLKTEFTRKLKNDPTLISR